MTLKTETSPLVRRQSMTLERYRQYVFISGNPSSVPAVPAPIISIAGPRSYDSTSWVTKEIDRRDWQKLIANNQCATTFLQGVHRRLDSEPFSAYIKVRKKVGVIGPTYYWDEVEEQASGYYVHSSAGDAFGPPNSPGFSADTAAKNQALGRFIEKALEAQQAFNGSLYLGEARESVRMLTGGVNGIAKRLQRYLDKTMKSSKDTKKRWLKKKGPKPPLREVIKSNIADQYLQATFGITPLVSDVISAAEALARLHMGNFLEVVPITAIGKTVATTYPYRYNEAMAHPTLQYMRLQPLVLDETERLVIFKGAVGVRTSDLSGAARYVGLDRYSFLPTLYNLIPWSFVNDYFTNTDEIVNAVAFPKSDIAWVQMTIVNRVRRLTTLEMTYDASTGYELVGTALSKGRREWKVTNVNRSRYDDSLVPTFELNGLGTKHWRRAVNILALVRNERHALSFVNNLLRR